MKNVSFLFGLVLALGLCWCGDSAAQCNIGANPSGFTLRTGFNQRAGATSPPVTVSPAIVGAIPGRAAVWSSTGSIVAGPAACATASGASPAPTPGGVGLAVPNTYIAAFYTNVNGWFSGAQGIKPVISGAVPGHYGIFNGSGVLIDSAAIPKTVVTSVAAPTPAPGYQPIAGSTLNDLPTIRAQINFRWCGTTPIAPVFTGKGKPGDVVVFASDGSPAGVGDPCVSATPSITPTPTIPTPTPTAAPTAGPTPIPGHFANLPPHATLPSAASCASSANASAFPETTPANVNDGTGWNSNNQIWANPSYFLAHVSDEIGYPTSVFNNVNGNYTGTTQRIYRYEACKYGMDEDWMYAEVFQEAGWRADCAAMHGGSGCRTGGDCGRPDGSAPTTTANLSFLGFATTDSSGHFIGPNFVPTTCGAPFPTWGAFQNKIQWAEWPAWPMGAVSTAWSTDYKNAKFRGCMNGDHDLNSNWTSDYTNAVSRAQSSPNAAVPGGQHGPTNLLPGETNNEYLALGCVGSHFCGNFYVTSNCVPYIQNTISIINAHGWPGGRP